MYKCNAASAASDANTSVYAVYTLDALSETSVYTNNVDIVITDSLQSTNSINNEKTIFCSRDVAKSFSKLNTFHKNLNFCHLNV